MNRCANPWEMVFSSKECRVFKTTKSELAGLNIIENVHKLKKISDNIYNILGTFQYTGTISMFSLP